MEIRYSQDKKTRLVLAFPCSNVNGMVAVMATLEKKEMFLAWLNLKTPETPKIVHLLNWDSKWQSVLSADSVYIPPKSGDMYENQQGFLHVVMKIQLKGLMEMVDKIYNFDLGDGGSARPTLYEGPVPHTTHGGLFPRTPLTAEPRKQQGYVGTAKSPIIEVTFPRTIAKSGKDEKNPVQQTFALEEKKLSFLRTNEQMAIIVVASKEEESCYKLERSGSGSKKWQLIFSQLDPVKEIFFLKKQDENKSVLIQVNESNLVLHKFQRESYSESETASDYSKEEKTKFYKDLQPEEMNTLFDLCGWKGSQRLFVLTSLTLATCWLYTSDDETPEQLIKAVTNQWTQWFQTLMRTISREQIEQLEKNEVTKYLKMRIEKEDNIFRRDQPWNETLWKQFTVNWDDLLMFLPEPCSSLLKQFMYMPSCSLAQWTHKLGNRTLDLRAFLDSLSMHQICAMINTLDTWSLNFPSTILCMNQFLPRESSFINDIPFTDVLQQLSWLAFYFTLQEKSQEEQEEEEEEEDSESKKAQKLRIELKISPNQSLSQFNGKYKPFVTKMTDRVLSFLHHYWQYHFESIQCSRSNVTMLSVQSTARPPRERVCAFFFSFKAVSDFICRNILKTPILEEWEKEQIHPPLEPIFKVVTSMTKEQEKQMDTEFSRLLDEMKDLTFLSFDESKSEFNSWMENAWNFLIRFIHKDLKTPMKVGQQEEKKKINLEIFSDIPMKVSQLVVRKDQVFACPLQTETDYVLYEPIQDDSKFQAIFDHGTKEKKGAADMDLAEDEQVQKSIHEITHPILKFPGETLSESTSIVSEPEGEVQHPENYNYSQIMLQLLPLDPLQFMNPLCPSFPQKTPGKASLKHLIGTALACEFLRHSVTTNVANKGLHTKTYRPSMKCALFGVLENLQRQRKPEFKRSAPTCSPPSSPPTSFLEPELDFGLSAGSKSKPPLALMMARKRQRAEEDQEEDVSSSDRPMKRAAKREKTEKEHEDEDVSPVKQEKKSKVKSESVKMEDIGLEEKRGTAVPVSVKKEDKKPVKKEEIPVKKETEFVEMTDSDLDLEEKTNKTGPSQFDQNPRGWTLQPNHEYNDFKKTGFFHTWLVKDVIDRARGLPPKEQKEGKKMKKEQRKELKDDERLLLLDTLVPVQMLGVYWHVALAVLTNEQGHRLTIEDLYKMLKIDENEEERALLDETFTAKFSTRSLERRQKESLICLEKIAKIQIEKENEEREQKAQKQIDFPLSFTTKPYDLETSLLALLHWTLRFKHFQVQQEIQQYEEEINSLESEKKEKKKIKDEKDKKEAKETKEALETKHLQYKKLLNKRAMLKRDLLVEDILNEPVNGQKKGRYQALQTSIAALTEFIAFTDSEKQSPMARLITSLAVSTTGGGLPGQHEDFGFWWSPPHLVMQDATQTSMELLWQCIPSDSDLKYFLRDADTAKELCDLAVLEDFMVNDVNNVQGNLSWHLFFSQDFAEKGYKTFGNSKMKNWFNARFVGWYKTHNPIRLWDDARKLAIQDEYRHLWLRFLPSEMWTRHVKPPKSSTQLAFLKPIRDAEYSYLHDITLYNDKVNEFNKDVPTKLAPTDVTHVYDLKDEGEQKDALRNLVLGVMVLYQLRTSGKCSRSMLDWLSFVGQIFGTTELLDDNHPCRRRTTVRVIRSTQFPGDRLVFYTYNQVLPLFIEVERKLGDSAKLTSLQRQENAELRKNLSEKVCQMIMHIEEPANLQNEYIRAKNAFFKAKKMADLYSLKKRQKDPVIVNAQSLQFYLTLAEENLKKAQKAKQKEEKQKRKSGKEDKERKREKKRIMKELNENLNKAEKAFDAAKQNQTWWDAKINAENELEKNQKEMKEKMENAMMEEDNKKLELRKQIKQGQKRNAELLKIIQHLNKKLKIPTQVQKKQAGKVKTETKQEGAYMQHPPDQLKIIVNQYFQKDVFILARDAKKDGTIPDWPGIANRRDRWPRGYSFARFATELSFFYRYILRNKEFINLLYKVFPSIPLFQNEGMGGQDCEEKDSEQQEEKEKEQEEEAEAEEMEEGEDSDTETKEKAVLEEQSRSEFAGAGSDEIEEMQIVVE